MESLLLALSFILFQSTVFLLLAIHVLAIRMLWTMIGGVVKTALFSAMGIGIAMAGRTFVQFKIYHGITVVPDFALAFESFSWSAASFTLAILLAQQERLLFESLAEHFQLREV